MKSLLTILLFFITPVILFSQSAPQYSWRYYRPGNTGIQGDIATALWVDENGDPYIAANTGDWGEGGVARFDQAENKWINYSNVDYQVMGSFDNGDIQFHEILQDYDQNLWMGSFTGALRFNPQGGITTMQNFGSGNSALLGFTMDMDIAPDSSVWFTSGALVRYNPKLDEWTSWEGSNVRISVQPKADGSYLVWSADTYYGFVFTYNSATQSYTSYMPEAVGDIAGLPGKDCVDEAGNFWALRMSENGNWETLEYQRPDGTWVYPSPPYENVSFYIDAFKAYGNGKALLVTANAETWMFDGTSWNNYGTWRPYLPTYSVDADEQGNVWVCGAEGAAKRDINTGVWQRYRITNTSQIDYFVEDLTIDAAGNVWFCGNAGSGVGGFQKFDGSRWTGFNPYTYGLGYPFPFEADNTQAIYARPSNGDIVINPTFHGIHTWNGSGFNALEDLFTSSEGFVEGSDGKLWSIGEYYSLRYYNDNNSEWISVPIVGWGSKVIQDPVLDGNIWALTDYEILRTDGITTLSLPIENFPGSAAWFTGIAVDQNGIMWTGTWSQFTSTGSTLIRYDSNTGEFQTWSYDEGWPFPGEHVRPLAITPDGRLWMQYDSEYPSTNSGILWFDGTTVESLPSSPGGVPQWGGLPNSTIKDLEVRQTANGYELWMSCLGRGIAVLDVVTGNVGVQETSQVQPASALSAKPNPASEMFDISFTMKNSGQASLSVFDMQGRLVKELLNSALEKGQHTVRWDLLNHAGSGTGKGVYVAKLWSDGNAESIKLVVR